jgi:hypothetical protein
MAYKEGEKVKWNWGNSSANGKVQKVYTEKITRKITGAEIRRNADDDNPAYYIEQDDGDHVLKSHSELEKS